jgi:TIR domain
VADYEPPVEPPVKPLSIFISHSSKDILWAEWIAWQVEALGHSAIIDVWDWRPGTNFIAAMQQATATADRTLVVLSPHYFEGNYTGPEWTTVLTQRHEDGSIPIIPVRVAEMVLPGLFRPLVHVDLVGLGEASAREALEEALRKGRVKPTAPPDYPGPTAEERQGREHRYKPQFPGAVTEESAESVGSAPLRDARDRGAGSAARAEDRDGIGEDPAAPHPPALPSFAGDWVWLVSVIMLLIFLIQVALLPAISTGSFIPSIVLAVVFAAFGASLALRPFRTAARRIVDHKGFAAGLIVANLLLLASGLLMLSPAPPVVLLVASERLIRRLGDPIKVVMTLEGPEGKAGEPREIADYEGERILIGSRKNLVLPPDARQNHTSSGDDVAPRVFPGSPIDLKAGMRIYIKLYYANSNKLYLDPPQGPILVRDSRTEKSSIQEVKLDGP